MVQAVREAGASQRVSSPHPPLVLSLKSEALTQPKSQADSHGSEVHTASCNTHTHTHTAGRPEKLLAGPEAHFMFLSIQSLKGSTLVKAVERLWLHVLS